MPNHVSHRVIVTGPAADLAAFVEKAIVTRTEADGTGASKDYQTFDFNAFLPMPAILEGTVSGSSANFGYEILTGKPRSGAFSNASVLEYQWIKELGIQTLEELRAHAEEQHPDWLIDGQKAIDAERETGHTDWYSWRLENWGTKWGAYDFQGVFDTDTSFEFTFNTAWSPASPVYELMVREFPTLAFEIDAFDEGWNFAYRAAGKNGVFEEETLDADDDAYERVFGERPDHDIDFADNSETGDEEAA